MKISKDKYSEVINALDGIRCDNRENRQDIDSPKPIRNIPDDVYPSV